MVAKRTSDDWPTLAVRTLRFNALLSGQPDDLLSIAYRLESAKPGMHVLLNSNPVDGNFASWVL